MGVEKAGKVIGGFIIADVEPLPWLIAEWSDYAILKHNFGFIGIAVMNPYQRQFL